MIADVLRDKLHRALTSRTGDSLAALRVPKDLARRLNEALGTPICSSDEIAKRREGAARLADLRSGRIAKNTETERAVAPVMVYFEKNRNERELVRIRETLDAKSIAYTELDVAGDEATLSFVTQRAKCEADDLPVVFVAGEAIGSFRALVEADVSGELERLVRGEKRA